MSNSFFTFADCDTLHNSIDFLYKQKIVSKTPIISENWYVLWQKTSPELSK